MTDRVLYCTGPECERPVAGHGLDLCSTHMKQAQRNEGKLTPIAEKISPKEHLLNLYDRFAEADGDEEADAAERAFWTQAKAILKSTPNDADVDELVRKAISTATRRRMAAAKARGVHVGRPSRADRQEAARLLALSQVDLVAIVLGVSRATVYRILKRTPSATTPRASSPRPT